MKLVAIPDGCCMTNMNTSPRLCQPPNGKVINILCMPLVILRSSKHCFKEDLLSIPSPLSKFRSVVLRRLQYSQPVPDVIASLITTFTPIRTCNLPSTLWSLTQQEAMSLDLGIASASQNGMLTASPIAGGGSSLGMGGRMCLRVVRASSETASFKQHTSQYTIRQADNSLRAVFTWP